MFSILSVPAECLADQPSDAELLYSLMNLDTQIQTVRSTGIFGVDTRIDLDEAEELFRKKVIDALERIYTPEELQALREFYGSETGKSIQRKGQSLASGISRVVAEVYEELKPDSSQDRPTPLREHEQPEKTE